MQGNVSVKCWCTVSGNQWNLDRLVRNEEVLM
jgi:hypothetical protein